MKNIHESGRGRAADEYPESPGPDRRAMPQPEVRPAPGGPPPREPRVETDDRAPEEAGYGYGV